MADDGLAAPFVVYIVDDDPSVVRSMSLLLEAHGYETRPSASPEGFQEQYEPGRLGCLFLDVRLPAENGIDVLARLVAEGYRLPVIMLTGHGDVPMAVRAIKNGALDFLEKPASERVLLSVLAHARKAALSQPPPPVAPRVVAERLARLTGRERQVLDQMLLGRTNKEIARVLEISQRTVEIHRARVRDKMEAQTLAELIELCR